MSNIVKFDFHGDALDVIPEAGEAWVSVRRVCDALGITFSPQRTKLAQDPSISVSMIVTQADRDDQAREIFCVSVRSLPLWLATIHPSKVAPAVREKLIAYKREVADVLADHFLGPRDQVRVGEELKALREDRTALGAELALMKNEMVKISSKVVDVENRLLLGSGMVSTQQRGQIRSAKARAARVYVAAGLSCNVRSALRSLQNGVNVVAGWGGAGQRDALLPGDLFTRVLAHLEGEEKKALKAVKIRQQELPGVGNVVDFKSRKPRGRR